MSEQCAAQGCESKGKKRNLCQKHYMRLRRTGTTESVRPTAEARFWRKVEKTETCWNWSGTKNSYGYGVIRVEGQPKKAHRYSYEIVNGDIPQGMFLDHRCHNRGCVNPDHLRVVTAKQNMENLDGPHRHNATSGGRGVYLARNGKWQARTNHNKKIYTAGIHDTIEQAEAAVIALRNQLHTHNDSDRQQQRGA